MPKYGLITEGIYLVVGVEGEDSHQKEVGSHTPNQHWPRLNKTKQMAMLL
jgi:hypothetical protein